MVPYKFLAYCFAFQLISVVYSLDDEEITAAARRRFVPNPLESHALLHSAEELSDCQYLPYLVSQSLTHICMVSQLSYPSCLRHYPICTIPGVIATRRSLHKIPELGGQEFKTSEYIKTVLNDLGIPFKCVKT
jgi:hypothetical protein